MDGREGKQGGGGGGELEKETDINDFYTLLKCEEKADVRIVDPSQFDPILRAENPYNTVRPLHMRYMDLLSKSFDLVLMHIISTKYSINQMEIN